MRHFVLGLWFFLALASCAPLSAQGLRPHEPLNPAKAQSLPTSPLTIESGAARHAFTVELATTGTERDTGLMHRNTLAADRGMLFDFQREQPVRFWMRNTFIPLDMIFVRANGQIAAIAENTVPHSEKPVGAPQPVQAVLELAGGTAARLGIKPGDVIHHPIFKN
jgi:uncharacterized membrane protein (UPF0127 family)